jgi:hypothetical protein
VVFGRGIRDSGETDEEAKAREKMEREGLSVWNEQLWTRI